MQRRFTAQRRKYQTVLAKNRQTLGIRPEYGAPVMMPPSDRLSGALSIASSVVGIASGLQGMGLFSGASAAGSFGSAITSGSALGMGASSSLLTMPVFPAAAFLDPSLS